MGERASAVRDSFNVENEWTPKPSTSTPCGNATDLAGSCEGALATHCRRWQFLKADDQERLTRGAAVRRSLSMDGLALIRIKRVFVIIVDDGVDLGHAANCLNFHVYDICQLVPLPGEASVPSQHCLLDGIVLKDDFDRS